MVRMATAYQLKGMPMRKKRFGQSSETAKATEENAKAKELDAVAVRKAFGGGA